jgi:hypothetical protein
LFTGTFEKVRDQIGFCGIWCGSCSAGNGAILELARRFEEVVKKHNLEKWAPKEFDFKEFTKGLTCIQAMPLCSGCRKGGGPPTCKIRICALEKGVVDCGQCNQLIECRNFDEIEKSHPKMKQDLLKIKNVDRNEVIEKWYSELKTKWPHCILLCTH